MTSPPSRSAPVLDPVARVSEVAFGLIMALTFTGALSVATADDDEVRTMLIGAIGCNIAWGLVDAVMYVMTQLTVRGHALDVIRRIKAETDPASGRHLLANEIEPPLDELFDEDDLETFRRRLAALPSIPPRATLTTDDFRGAVGTFLLVVTATFPVVVPFLLFDSATTALRISNAVAVVMLFACGFQLGRHAAHRPWRMGVAMAVIGSILVGLTIALGG